MDSAKPPPLPTLTATNSRPPLALKIFCSFALLVSLAHFASFILALVASHYLRAAWLGLFLITYLLSTYLLFRMKWTGYILNLVGFFGLFSTIHVAPYADELQRDVPPATLLGIILLIAFNSAFVLPFYRRFTW